MIIKKRKFTIPEYREKKEIFELLGYKEEKYEEKGIYAYVTFSLDENSKNYFELRKLESQVYRKGPPFFPIILFVACAFVFLSLFVIFLAIAIKDKNMASFDLNANAVGFLLPAFLCLTACVVYTYFYFSINKKIIEKGKPTKDELAKTVEEIKKK